MNLQKRLRSRRDFIQLSLFSMALTLSSLSCQKLTKASQASIIVIGAGIAGLAAARQLQAQGFKVTILEGRDSQGDSSASRIGGRIYTNRSLGVPVDLGAQWIHGINGNPIGKLAKEFNLRTLPTHYENIEVYGSNGQRVQEKDLERGEALYDRIIQKAKAAGEKLENDISVAEAVKRIVNRENLTAEQKNILQWYLNSAIVLEYGTDLQDLSIWELDEDEAFGGNDYLFPNGYDQIVQGLAKGIDVQLQQKVIEIEYSDRGVFVKTEKSHKFQADAAIITLPLGVLKSGSVNFSPPLPKAKQEAIARLDMGCLNKIVLKFPKIFWSKDYDMIGTIRSSDKDFAEFLNWSKYTSDPILIALIGGSFSRRLEKMSEAEVEDKMMKILRQIYGNKIPSPEAVIRTQWGQDPFSFGSYSCMPVGATAGDRATLASPIDRRLFFAGEATSSQYPATVHGAFLSGIREAERISKQFDRES